MRHLVSRLGPALWVLCASLLLLPLTAVAGESSLASDTTRTLVSHVPLQHVAAIDLDGQDRDPEEELTGGDFGLWVVPRTSAIAPPDDASSVCVAPRASTCLPSPVLSPVAPRPPPA